MLPILAVAVLFGVVFTFTDMSVVYLLTRGGPYNSTHVLASLAFQDGVLGGDVGRGAVGGHLPGAPAGGDGGGDAADLSARRGGVGGASAGRRILATLGHRALILGFTAFAVFPFYWMLITAFKQNADLYVGASNTAHNPFIFNRPPTLEHLQILFEQTRCT